MRWSPGCEMTYQGALLSRPARLRKRIVRLAAAWYVTLLIPLVAFPDESDSLQKQAIQKIDQYRDYARRTGDVTSLLPALQKAQNELVITANAFLAKQNLASAALSFIKLGDIERLQNHWNAARPLYSRARQLAKQANNQGYEALALIQMSRTELLGGGDLGAAAEYIAQAIPLATASGNQDYLFEVLDQAANLEIKRGNLNAAADYLERAFALQDQIHDKSLAMYGYMDRASVYYARASKCDYETTFDICDEAFQLAHNDYQQAFHVAEASGYNFLAGQMQKLLQSTDAKRQLTQNQGRYNRNALESTSGIFHPKKASDVLVNPRFTPGPDPARQAQIESLLRTLLPNLDNADATSLFVQGMSAQMKGDNDAAIASFMKAVDLVERDRRNLRDEQSRGTFLEDKIHVYYAPALLLLDLHRQAEAFDLMERSRSRAMADMLAAGPLTLRTPLERELFSQLMKLKADIALQQKKLFELITGEERAKHAAEIADSKARIATLEGQYEKVQASIAASAPKLEELTVSQVVSLANAQTSANNDAYDLLYYLVQENNVIIWDINGQGVRVLSVFLPHTQLAVKIAAIRNSLLAHEKDASAKFDEQTSRELFLFLIQPVWSSIKTHHIVIIPHEDLNSLAFQVLLNPADDSYLGEKFQISYAPSATVLAALKTKPNLAGGHLFAAADPAIADSVREVETIGRFYPGRSKVVKDVLVKKDELQSLIGGYDIVHLSMHGSFQANDPMLSYLKLASTDQDNGRLTAAEMFGLPLAKDSFVVLSACQTGQVEATHSNEVLGLMRALLYAGANNLVLSSWQVQSEATALWMENFYRAAQTNPPSEAARLALLAVKSRPEYRDPYFWGPFLFTGK
jgi:CHAT domain-containing protein